MLVFRIVHKKYTDLTPSGMEGRWNSSGNRVIYTAESIPLAFLESMIRRQGAGFADNFKIVTIELPGKSNIEEVLPEALPTNWRTSKDFRPCQLIGDSWYRKANTLALKLPSALLPFCYNYVLNCQHADSSKLKIIAVTDLVPDGRIEEILTKYR